MPPKVSILLVDDRPSNMLALESILQDDGLNLVKAASGEQALRCVLSHEFAMILLDVQMPGMDGYETATLIRQRERTKDTPIIFLTAASRTETHVSLGYSLGAVDYIFRPIEPEILRSKVAVFVELFRKREQVAQQAEALRRSNEELDRRVQERTAELAERNAALQAEIAERQRAEAQRAEMLAREQAARAAAEAAEVRYRQLFEGVADALLVTSPDGSYLDANSAATALLGYTQEELRRLRVSDLICAEDAASAAALTASLAQGHWRGEFEVCRKNGTLVPVEGQTTTIELPTGTVCVAALRDISERRAVQQMQQDFLAMVSHELQTPLTSLKGFAQILQRRGEYSEKAVTTILKQTARLERLISDLLMVTRLETGQLDLRRVETDLVTAARSSADLAGQLSADHEIVVEVPSHPVLGWWDPDRLAQILANLLSNAVKYSPNGRRVWLRVEPRLDAVEVSVQDEGCGVAPEALPHLFERFYRSDGAATYAPGLGLGLYITHLLVKSHGGDIRVESVLQQGTTVSFVLPYGTPEEAAA